MWHNGRRKHLRETHMEQAQTAIDLDGKERTIAELCDRHDLTVRALRRRLVTSDDGPPKLRPAYKAGRKRKQEQAGK
jgi:hypothetical protein